MLLLLCTFLLPLLAAEVSSLPHGGSGIIGAKKFATADDCSGVVAFSGVGATLKEDKLTFNSGLVDRSVGWNRENGEFTCHCPGLYQFSFASTGDKDARLSLKKKSFTTESWTTVVTTGLGGGASLTLLDMEIGDQVAVFLDAGKLDEETKDSPISVFSGFRLSKK